jgi:DNA-binding NarL/FixJ family response regulator
MKNQKKNKIKVLLVDDHPVVLEGIRSCLRPYDQFNIVGMACSGEEAVAKAPKVLPDVILMDMRMPGMDGLETTRKLRDSYPTGKVLIFAGGAEHEIIGEMVQSGARGCLRKSATTEELTVALERVYQGETFFSPGIAQTFFNDYVLRGGNAPEPAAKRISERERQVLRLIVEGEANKGIADTLNISIRTVEKHRQRMMKKFDLHKATELVRFAITRGIVNLNTN